MTTLRDHVLSAIERGDTAEAIARRAKVSGETVRRVVRGQAIQAQKADAIAAVLGPHDSAAPVPLSPQVARQMEWAESTLVSFAREYTARIAEALGASMAAAIRQGGAGGPTASPASVPERPTHRQVDTLTRAAQHVARVTGDQASRPAAKRRAR